MGRLLLIFLLIPLFACAESDQIFSETEDVSVFQYVDVITGNLCLPFQDVVAQGALPISLMRTYSSSGVPEGVSEYADLLLKGYRQGWIIQGGWNLLPHIYLIIEPSGSHKYYKVFVSEPSGNVISYRYSYSKEKRLLVFKPDQAYSQYSGQLNVRTNPQYNTLELNEATGEAKLFLPNGGTRVYQGIKLKNINYEINKQVFYTLKTETLPSKHQLRFQYDNKTNLEKIESTNPSGKKIYASMVFNFVEKQKQPFQLTVTTSDDKKIEYHSILHDGRRYISELKSSGKPKEAAYYHIGKKNILPRVSSFDLAGKQQLKVNYYLPGVSGADKTNLNRVESIFSPVGPKGESTKVAGFKYFAHSTDVRDAEGLLIRYHHDGKKLHCIEYFDGKEILRSSQKFYYEGEYLRCKAMFDGTNQPVFAKTFKYSGGNVEEECLWGCLSGEEVPPLQIDAEGKPAGAECYKKTYTYYADNLLKTESEEEGVTNEYFYKSGTDLITIKFTKNQKGEILIREFSSFDDDNFLKFRITDNGTAIDPDDYTGVTQRLEKTLELNSEGFPGIITEQFWDPETSSLKMLKKTKVTYKKGKLSTEEVFDSSGESRYTLRTDYDEFGQVKQKTTPLGRENTYYRDGLGRLKESKEVGSPKKIFTYDDANRQTSCLEVDSNEETLATYDFKGRVLTQTDPRGNVITHAYDCFGNRETTTFPKIKLENEKICEPKTKFGYDIHGNLTSAEMPLGETTQTSYNLLRKPTLITQSDGTEIRHYYNKSGTLARTILPDKTQVEYKYDFFRLCCTIPVEQPTA
jgi:YD repeat-containing protein